MDYNEEIRKKMAELTLLFKAREEYRKGLKLTLTAEEIANLGYLKTTKELGWGDIEEHLPSIYGEVEGILDQSDTLAFFSIERGRDVFFILDSFGLSNIEEVTYLGTKLKKDRKTGDVSVERE